MTTVQVKLDLLQEAIEGDESLNRVLDKLLDVTLAQQQASLARYNAELRIFEDRYGKPSAEFYQEFESGKLGDDMDFFEWAGLFELQQDLFKRVARLEMSQ